MRDTLTEPSDGILHERHSDREKVEGDGKLSVDTQNIANVNRRSLSIRPNISPGAYQIGGSNQDDNDGINTVYNYQEFYNNQEFSQMLPQQPQQYSANNNSYLSSPQLKSKVKKKKLWLVLSIIIIVVVAISLGGVFLFTGEDEGGIPKKVWKAMGEMRDLIVSKLPQSSDAFADEASAQYKALLWVAQKKVEDPEFYTDKRSLHQYSLVTFKSTNCESGFSMSSDECEGGGVKCVGKTFDLELEGKFLNGTLPPEIALLPLHNLFLENNINLYGSIPSEIGLLSHLQKFSVINNKFSGLIPSEIDLLSQMKVLILQRNGLFNFTSGTIPSEIGLLGQTLSGFVVTGTQLTGSIPSEIGLLSKVTNLALYDNELLGSIPSEIGLSKQIKGLYLHDNKLEGSIPSEIGLLSQILNLRISNNQISGSIPSEIGLLGKVTTLDLNLNRLSGSIPSEIGLLGKISNLRLYSNPNLLGSIPDAICEIDFDFDDVLVDEKVFCEYCKKN